MKKIPSLDGLRAVSILLVLLNHASDTTGVPFYFHKYAYLFFSGTLGVNIFFVISGYLITYLLLKEKKSHAGRIDIKHFYQRRLLRILPVCYLFIALVFVFNRMFNFNVKDAFFASAATFTMNFCAAPWAVGHLWTLAIEEQFYLFWPWVANLAMEKLKKVAIIIILYAPAARVIGYLHPHWAPYMLEPFFKDADCLMIGCLLAISQYSYKSIWKSAWLKNRLVFFLSIFVIWLVNYTYWEGSSPAALVLLAFKRTIVSFCVAYIIASVITVREGLIFKFLNHPLMVYIGMLSYSIYIWQQVFLFHKDQLISPAMWFQIFPVNIAMVFLFAVLSYHSWETYFLKMKERFKARKNIPAMRTEDEYIIETV